MRFDLWYIMVIPQLSGASRKGQHHEKLKKIKRPSV
jgi:hypothetical protein